MSAPDYVSAMEPVIEALEAEGIACYIGGSVASSILGVPRTTLDVDLVAALDVASVSKVVGRLGDAYYVDEAAVMDAALLGRSFNAIHLSTMFKVDVFVMGDGEYERVAMDRSRPVALEEAGGRSFRVASPEDVILHKLMWYRDGHEVAERQWKDVLGVLKIRLATLDRSYLATWAERLGVLELLDRAFVHVVP